MVDRIIANKQVDRGLVQQVWAHWIGTPSRLTDVKADKMVALIEQHLAR